MRNGSRCVIWRDATPDNRSRKHIRAHRFRPASVLPRMGLARAGIVRAGDARIRHRSGRQRRCSRSVRSGLLFLLVPGGRNLLDSRSSGGRALQPYGEGKHDAIRSSDLRVHCVSHFTVCVCAEFQKRRQATAREWCIRRTHRHVSQPFFSVKAAVYRIDGGELQVYNYRSASAAAKEAGRVAPNGAIGGAMPRWIAPPHFFRKGRVIAIYLGSSDKALKALTRVMGPQFAGK